MLRAVSRAPSRPAALAGGRGALRLRRSSVFVVPVELGEKLVLFLEFLYPLFPVFDLLRKQPNLLVMFPALVMTALPILMILPH